MPATGGNFVSLQNEKISDLNKNLVSPNMDTSTNSDQFAEISDGTLGIHETNKEISIPLGKHFKLNDTNRKRVHGLKLGCSRDRKPPEEKRKTFQKGRIN